MSLIMINRNKPVRVSLNKIPMLFDTWFKGALSEEDQDSVLEFIHAQLSSRFNGSLTPQGRRETLLKAQKTAMENFHVIK